LSSRMMTLSVIVNPAFAPSSSARCRQVSAIEGAAWSPVSYFHAVALAFRQNEPVNGTFLDTGRWFKSNKLV
jgi:hypothetical protein